MGFSNEVFDKIVAVEQALEKKISGKEGELHVRKMYNLQHCVYSNDCLVSDIRMKIMPRSDQYFCYDNPGVEKCPMKILYGLVYSLRRKSDGKIPELKMEEICDFVGEHVRSLQDSLRKGYDKIDLRGKWDNFYEGVTGLSRSLIRESL